MAIPDAAVRDDLDVLDRITGSLIGAAIGDGLGDLARHGHMVDSWPIPDPAELRVGGATQTMLFTLEGMIRMLVRLNIKGIGPGYQVLRHALDRWLFTQHPEDPEIVRRRWEWGNPTWPDGWLVRHHVLHHRRTRMATTVMALNLGKDVELTDRRVLDWTPNLSTGSGGLVRIGPAGALVAPHFSFEMGVRIAAQTHGSPDGYLPAGVVSRVVGGLIAGDTLDVSIDEADRELVGWPHSEATHSALQSKAGQPPNPRSAIGALSLAIRHVRADDNRDVVGLITKAAWGGGTAPAVIAGLILGAERGVSAFDPGWQNAPEVGEIVRDMALAAWLVNRKWVLGELLPGLEVDIGPDDGDYLAQVLWPRYPGW